MAALSAVVTIRQCPGCRKFFLTEKFERGKPVPCILCRTPTPDPGPKAPASGFHPPSDDGLLGLD